MLRFRRKSSVAGGGKSDAVSPPPPPAALADVKQEGHDADPEDIFSAVLSSATSKHQQQHQPVPAEAIAVASERWKERLWDEEKDGKRSPPPPPVAQRTSLSSPSLPSLSKSEFTPDTLRALTAVPSADREGAAVDESKEAGQQQHARKTSSSALIAEILGSKPTSDSNVVPTLTASTSLAFTTVLSPPPLLSGLSMTVEAPQRRELPLFNMREFHGDGEQFASSAPPSTPTAAPVAPARPPPPLTRSPTPPPRAAPPPISVVSPTSFADSASPITSSSARLPRATPPAVFSRSPPARPSLLSAAVSSPSTPVFSSDEGVPNTPHAPPLAAAAPLNPFDDDGEEVEGRVISPMSSVGRVRVVAVAAYTASAADQLACAANEVLEVVDDSHASWIMVSNERGVRGLVPASYLRKQRKEEEQSSAASLAMPPPAPRQVAVNSHRRTASQPPLQLLGQQPRPPTLLVPSSPVRGPPPISASPTNSPPSSTSRLPPPSPSLSSAPLALRLPQPSPPSHSASSPPALPRPLSTPPTPVAPSPLSPAPLSPLPSHEPASPSISFARSPTTSSSSPASPLAPRARLLSATATDSAAPTPAIAVRSMEVCEAAHTYSALAADQLSLTVGEKLLLVDRHHPHWWKVVNGAGETGLVPTTFIRLLDTPSAATSAFPAPPKPPPVPVSGTSIPLPQAASVLVTAPPPLAQARSLPPPVVSRPSPPPAPPALPASTQPGLPPPLAVLQPARQIPSPVATTPTATSSSSSTPITPTSVPQHRHSMSLNTISAPVKRVPPASIAAASAPATPTSARSAVLETPAFPLPPNSAARTSPMPSPTARLPPPAAPVPAASALSPGVAAGAAGASQAGQGGSAGTLVAERGEAVHSFDATDGVQLSVSRGDALFIMQRLETGWSVCRLLHTGITGLVPSSYIRSTTDRSAVG